jgi:hypothetical protein
VPSLRQSSRVAEAPEIMTMLQRCSWQRLRMTEGLAPEMNKVEPWPPALFIACDGLESVHSANEDEAQKALSYARDIKVPQPGSLRRTPSCVKQ